jgi:hypothetical protein
MGLYCPRCMRRRIKEQGRFNGTEGLGRVVPGLVFNDEEICSGCADELLDKIISKQERTIEELQQGFVLASQRTHPDLDDGFEW